MSETAPDSDDARLEKIWAKSWLLPDRRPPWQWLEDHVNAISYSPIPGSFRTDNSPWIREPLEELANPETSLISIVASIQACKTLFAELGLCWVTNNAPGPSLWLDQTDADAKDQCGTRLQPLWEGCPPVKKLVSKDKNRTKLDAVRFLNGMPLWIKGAHSKTNLQRRSIRWLWGDETWRWPDGHMAEAEARVQSFGWLGKRIFFSQAGIVDDDTDKKHRETDMREWQWRCQECGEHHGWKLDDMLWDDDAKDEFGNWDYERARNSVTMSCPDCGEVYPDTDRQRRILNRVENGARHEVRNPTAPKGNVGFHWNGFCAGSWGKLIELYLRAKASVRRGDTTDMEIFYQKRLALPFENYDEDFKMEISPGGYSKGDVWEDEGALDRKGRITTLAALFEEETELAEKWKREDLAGMPPKRVGGLLRFLTVDCQLDHLYVCCRAWNPYGSSRLLGWKKVQTYDDVEDYQKKLKVVKRLVFIDAGYKSYEIYEQCAMRGWTALMGDRKKTWTHRIRRKDRVTGKMIIRSVERFYSPVKSIPFKSGVARLHYYSNLGCKDVLNNLRGNQDPTQGPTWDVYDDIDDEYLKQMESEQRIKQKNGTFMWETVTEHADNHLWDAETMSACAALMLKLVGKESVVEVEDESS